MKAECRRGFGRKLEISRVETVPAIEWLVVNLSSVSSGNSTCAPGTAMGALRTKQCPARRSVSSPHFPRQMAPLASAVQSPQGKLITSDDPNPTITGKKSFNLCFRSLRSHATWIEYCPSWQMCVTFGTWFR